MITASDDGVLRDLAPRPPGVVLEDLARISGVLASNGRPRPDIELGLANGQVVRGKIVSLASGVALVHLGGQPRSPSVAYVRVDQIVALTLPDASVLAHEPVLASDAPVPSRLELARRVAGLMPPIGFGADLDDGARRAIGALLPTLQHALYQIASDPMGKGALAAVEGIDLTTGATANVVRDGKRVVIHAPVLAAEAFSLISLKVALERVL